MENVKQHISLREAISIFTRQTARVQAFRIAQRVSARPRQDTALQIFSQTQAQDAGIPLPRGRPLSHAIDAYFRSLSDRPHNGSGAPT